MGIIMKCADVALTTIAGTTALLTTWPGMSTQLGYDPRNSMTNAVALAYSLTKHFWLNKGVKPACVVAGIPLPSTDELSHGISDREVRYRANGGVFLAHQSGGNESLRIIGKAWGFERFWFLNLLDLLFIWGSTKTIDVYNQSLNSNVRRLAIEGSGNETKRLVAATTDPWQEFNDSSLDQGFEEQHLSFPIITKDRVYLSMYIETYSWRQRLDKEGRKMVEYTIFFRKYEPNAKYEYATIEIPSKDPTNQKPKQIKVFQERTSGRPLLLAAWKSGLEILTTMSAHSSLFSISNFQKFGQQMFMNYFGIKDYDNKIPGIIEQRGFF